MTGIAQSPERDVASTQMAVNTPIGFLDLPSELRNMIYDLALFHEESIDACYNCYGRERRTTGLLRANQLIYREASSVLYGRNCFNFVLAEPDQLASFFKQIGPNNASYIQHVSIQFPQFLYLNPEDVAFQDRTIKILADIQKSCVNLRALTTSLGYSLAALTPDLPGYRGVIVKALELVNAFFRANPSLRDINVHVYNDGPSDYIKTVMERCGWTVSITEREEGWEEEWEEEIRYVGYDYGDHYSSGYEYGFDEDDYDSDYYLGR
ncbi:uncharacterized protein B0H64DRAFT_210248 [Chaetomium fimeti]|uniref:F-box domain-containing protein n=1 Tax=Chaetomium fimeti TaxID=1854472 RepID=A0AAE0HCY3_9PEZI|nr:hypothetical protein B0H64DRAFT_210248 [Chaetomium fimeti]